LQADLTMGNLASALTLQSDEAALIAELQAGSEDAFAWLIERYHQPIYSLLARTVQDRSEAADLAQEVFVKVYRGISGFHGNASLRTWIYRIALHEASNQRRWWSRHCRQEVTIEAETGESSEGQPAAFDDAWPKLGRSRGGDAPRRGGRAPSTFPETTADAAGADRHPPAAPMEDQPPVTVLKSGVVDGMAYSLYSDGSIEAQMPEGMMRFASIDELRMHLDQRP